VELEIVIDTNKESVVSEFRKESTIVERLRGEELEKQLQL
jgi:hypothetical protein